MRDMEITLEAGVTVDLATKGDLEQHHRWLQERFRAREAVYRVLTQSVPAGANTLLLDFGAPPAGMLYAVQWVAVMADQPFGAAIANVTAAAFVGNANRPVTSSMQANTNDLVVPGIAVPSTTNVPDLTICRGGQHIYVLVSGSGLVAGTTVGYNANCGVLQAKDEPGTVAWI